jgi:hypothetical protein
MISFEFSNTSEHSRTAIVKTAAPLSNEISLKILMEELVMDNPRGHGSKVIGSGIAVMLLMGLVACGGPPKWVKQGSGAFHEKDSKAFYGVGSVIGIKNEPLAWDTAENRARAEIAKSFETYTGYLMRDYAASTTAGDFTRNTEEQNVERAIKTITITTLSGVRPVDRYKDEKAGAYYVLAKLDLEDMKNNLEQAKELNAQVRDFVRQNADKLFDRLEKEEDKRANR